MESSKGKDIPLENQNEEAESKEKQREQNSKNRYTRKSRNQPFSQTRANFSDVAPRVSAPTKQMTSTSNPLMINPATSPGITAANAPNTIPNFFPMFQVQNMMNLQQTCFFPQGLNFPNMVNPNMGVMQNMHGASGFPMNQQQFNMMQYGFPRTPGNFPSYGMQQNRMNMSRVQTPNQRMNFSQQNIQFPPANLSPPYLGMMHPMRNVPPLNMNSKISTEQKQMQQIQKQYLHQQQQFQEIHQQQQKQLQQMHQFQQQLQQQQAINVQMNYLKTLGSQSPRTSATSGSHTQGINIPQVNVPQNVQAGVPPKSQNESDMQYQMSLLAMQQSLANEQLQTQQNLLNVAQQQVMNASTAVSSLSPITSDISPRLPKGSQSARMSTGTSRGLPLRTTEMNNMARMRMPQLSHSIQQHQRPMVPQQNAAQNLCNVPQVGMQQLSSNVPVINVPQLQPNFPQSSTNTDQQTANNRQILNSSTLGAPLFEGNIQQINSAMGTSRFRTPLYARNVPAREMSNTSQIQDPDSIGSSEVITVQSGGARAPQMPRLPRASVPQLFMGTSRFGVPQPFTLGVPHTAGNVPDMHPSTSGSQFNLQQRTQTSPEKPSSTSTRIQVAGLQRRVTGVTSRLSGVVCSQQSVSQQSASAPQPVEGQKCIISCPEKENQKEDLNQTRDISLKSIQKRRLKKRLALLKLWKRYEQYHLGKLVHGICKRKGMRIKQTSKRQHFISMLKKSKICKT